jgi:hypothetical protein
MGLPAPPESPKFLMEDMGIEDCIIGPPAAYGLGLAGLGAGLGFEGASPIA